MPDVDDFDDVDVVKLQSALGQHASKIGYQDYGECGEGLQFYLMGRQATVLARVRLIEMEDGSWRPYMDMHPWIRQQFKSVGIILEDDEYHPDDFTAGDRLSMWQLRDVAERRDARKLREAG